MHCTAALQKRISMSNGQLTALGHEGGVYTFDFREVTGNNNTCQHTLFLRCLRMTGR